MVPRYFAHKIVAECLRGIYPLQQVNEIMSAMPLPTYEQTNGAFVRELVAFVNSDNRYKLCIVNRRNCRWAMFILTPYGTVRTEQLTYAFGIPYEETYDSAIANSMDDMADILEEVRFNSTVIAEAFIDADDLCI